MRAAEAANALATLGEACLFSLNPIRQRARLNALLWERMRGIAFEGWAA